MKRIAAAVLATAVIMTLLLLTGGPGSLEPSTAEAHVSNGQSYWYWELFTRRTSSDQTPGPRTDPTAIVWTAGPQAPIASQDAVRDAVNEFWGNRPASNQMTFDQLCLGQSRVARALTDSGTQELRFRTPGGWLRDVNDYQGSTSRTCLSQWHMRFWDDQEHTAAYPDHGSPGQWVVSGIHFDKSTGSVPLPDGPIVGRRYGTGHSVSGRWNVYRNFGVNKALRSLCGRSRWRQFPGADREWRGSRMDGYIARIDFQRDDQGCPPGLY